MSIAAKLAASCCTGFLLASPAMAEQFEWPARKPGHWELHTKAGADMPEMTVQVCLDAETDKGMMQMGTGVAKSMCPDQKIDRRDGKIIIDGTCEVGGIKVSGRTEISGDFQSDYSMVIVSDIADAPEGMAPTSNVEHNGRWVSATCQDGMVPGDMVMPGGVKVNLKSMKGMMDALGGP